MKKAVKILLSCSMLAGVLTGCTSSAGTGEELNIYAWTEYIPQSVLDKFEEETGVEVNLTTYSSNEDMLAKVKSETEGTYDLVQPTDYMAELMIEQGLVQSIDFDQVANVSYIDEAYLNPSFDPTGEYTVPYLGGLMAIAINTDKVSQSITSYADLFDSGLDGSLVVLDDYRAIIGMAAVSLGYDFNETDPAKLEEIEAQLMKLKDNVKLYDSDSPKSALISGDCTIGAVWNAEIALAMNENPNIEIVYPEEGAFKFLDNWAVPTGAKNYDNAMAFLNFICEPENMELVLQEFPYMCANGAAVELMGEDYAANIATNIPSQAVAISHSVANLDIDTLATYDSMWTKLKE